MADHELWPRVGGGLLEVRLTDLNRTSSNPHLRLRSARLMPTDCSIAAPMNSTFCSRLTGRNIFAERLTNGFRNAYSAFGSPDQDVALEFRLEPN
jgi:hypothetical protein